MGLPGSGKTWIAERLYKQLNCAWYNADKVREMANDWEFSAEARQRQAMRMRTIADFERNQGRHVICDFVCPTKITRTLFKPDITVWVNTIDSGRFEDTNKVFEKPNNPDFEIIRHLSDDEIMSLGNQISERIA